MLKTTIAALCLFLSSVSIAAEPKWIPIADSFDGTVTAVVEKDSIHVLPCDGVVCLGWLGGIKNNTTTNEVAAAIGIIRLEFCAAGKGHIKWLDEQGKVVSMTPFDASGTKLNDVIGKSMCIVAAKSRDAI